MKIIGLCDIVGKILECLLNNLFIRFTFEKNSIIRKGKNWYVSIDDIIITVNAYSYTIVTTHKQKIL